jgi:hypothetical protein
VLVVAPASHRLAWIGVLLALPAFTLLQLSVENAAFLIYPLRLVRVQRTGMSAMMVVRLYAVLAVKLLVLGIALAVPAALALLAHWLVGNRVLTGLVALIALGLVTATFVWLVGRIFLRVDPSRQAI